MATFALSEATSNKSGDFSWGFGGPFWYFVDRHESTFRSSTVPVLSALWVLPRAPQPQAVTALAVEPYVAHAVVFTERDVNAKVYSLSH